MQLGIVSVENPECAVTDILAKMSPEEAFKAKRKFRKVWRRMLKSKQHINRRGPLPRFINAMKNRRFIVLNWLLRQMEPLLDTIPSVDHEYIRIRGPPYDVHAC
jgi:hypothetical protein